MLLPVVISNMIFYAHVCYNMTYLYRKYVRKLKNSLYLADQKSDDTDPLHLLNQTCNVLEKSDATVFSDDSLGVQLGSNRSKFNVENWRIYSPLIFVASNDWKNDCRNSINVDHSGGIQSVETIQNAIELQPILGEEIAGDLQDQTFQDLNESIESQHSGEE